jgi:pimeloyl-ACP methyl ester carboxylesterase
MQETGALMFAVEHRYYGCHNTSACPVEDVNAKGGLRFLSSRQALGDLAAFHAFATTTYGLSSENKWVSFGGSYPGMLAGWLRLKFPHLIHAAVASSAPVRAQLDMVGYNDVTADAYAVSDNNVGGSPECAHNIANGHAIIKERLNTVVGRAQLAAQFSLSSTFLEDQKNIVEFAGSGVASFPSQGNDPSCQSPACNIASICGIMTDPKIVDNVTRLAAVRAAQSQSMAKTARRSMMPLLRRHRLNAGAAVEPDYWGYQTCTEFGFYQTCEVGSRCLYTQGLVLLSDYLDMCSSFGITARKVSENIDYTNEYYGALDPAGSRVLFANGEVDPWRALSIVSSPSSDLPVLEVAGASHHAWTHPTAKTDQLSVQLVRRQIKSVVTEWLQVPSMPEKVSENTQTAISR